MCQPKSNGGLGARDVRVANLNFFGEVEMVIDSR